METRKVSRWVNITAVFSHRNSNINDEIFDEFSCGLVNAYCRNFYTFYLHIFISNQYMGWSKNPIKNRNFKSVDLYEAQL